MKHLWNTKTAKTAPIGAASFLAPAAIAVCCVAFDVLTVFPTGSPGRTAVFLLALGYLLFPAVACSIYSALFESPKALALAGLALTALIAALEFFTVAVFLDGLLLLPFWFLAVMGIVKFVKWRRSRRTKLAPSQ